MEEIIYHLDLPQELGVNILQGNYEIKEINKQIMSLPDDLRIPFSMHLVGYNK